MTPLQMHQLIDTYTTDAVYIFLWVAVEWWCGCMQPIVRDGVFVDLPHGSIGLHAFSQSFVYCWGGEVQVGLCIQIRQSELILQW